MATFSSCDIDSNHLPLPKLKSSEGKDKNKLHIELIPVVFPNDIFELLRKDVVIITFLTQEGADKALSLSPIKCEVTQEEYDKALEALILIKPTNCDVTQDDINKAPALPPIKYGVHVMFLHS